MINTDEGGVRRKPSIDENFDMLCPICVEACFCDTELVSRSSPLSARARNSSSARVSKSKSKSKLSVCTVGATSTTPTTTTTATATAMMATATITANNGSAVPNAVPLTKKTRSGPLKRASCGGAPVRNKKNKCDEDQSDAGSSSSGGRDSAAAAAAAPAATSDDYDADLGTQYALGEYYFSEVDDGADTEALVEYYGYSSGSDVNLESLFVVSSDGDGDGDESEDSGSDGGQRWRRDWREGGRVGLMGLQYGEDGQVSLAAAADPQSHDSSDPDELIDELQFLANDGPRRDRGAQLPPQKLASKREESLSEQLAKITPQILAAISVAAKSININCQHHGPYHHYGQQQQQHSGVFAGSQRVRHSEGRVHHTMFPSGAYPNHGDEERLLDNVMDPEGGGSVGGGMAGAGVDVGLGSASGGGGVPRRANHNDGGCGGYDDRGEDRVITIEEIFDTSKLARILSTSPPPADSPLSDQPANQQKPGAQSQQSTQQSSQPPPPSRRVPIGAFYKSRRGSLQHSYQPVVLSSALRHGGVANCTLTPAPVLPDELLYPLSPCQSASPGEQDGGRVRHHARRRPHSHGRPHGRHRSRQPPPRQLPPQTIVWMQFEEEADDEFFDNQSFCSDDQYDDETMIDTLFTLSTTG